MKSLSLTAEALLTELRLFAHAKDMSINEDAWPERITLTYWAHVQLPKGRSRIPFGPYLRIAVSRRPDPMLPRSQIVSISVRPTWQSYVIIVAGIALVALGFYGLLSSLVFGSLSLKSGKWLAIGVTAFVLSLPLNTLGKDAYEGIWRLERSLWEHLEMGSGPGLWLARWSLGMAKVLRPLLAAGGVLFLCLASVLVVLGVELEGASKVLTLVWAAMMFLIGYGLPVSALPLFRRLQVLAVIRSALLLLALSGPFCLLVTYRQYVPLALRNGNRPDLSVGECLTTTEAQDVGLAFAIAAMGAAACTILPGLLPSLVRQYYMRGEDKLRSATHPELNRQQLSKGLTVLAFASASPWLCLQLIGWLAAIFTVPWLLWELAVKGSGRLLEFLLLGGQSAVGLVGRAPGAGGTWDNGVRPIGAAAGIFLMIIICGPWVVLMSHVLSGRARLRRRTRPVRKDTLDKLPVIAEDVRRLSDSLGGVRIRLCWDLDEKTGTYWIGRRSVDVVVATLPLCRAELGNDTSLRFMVHHEVAHIRKRLSHRFPWFLEWLCAPITASFSVLSGKDFREEYESDLEAAWFLTREQAVASIRGLRADQELVVEEDTPWRQFWIDIRSSFCPHSTPFTPSPAQRIARLEDREAL